VHTGKGRGNSKSGKLVFSHLSVFCKKILATGGLVPISGQLGGLLCNSTEIFMDGIAALPAGFRRRREKVWLCCINSVRLQNAMSIVTYQSGR